MKVLYLCEASELGGAVISLYEMLEVLSNNIEIVVVAPKNSVSYFYFNNRYETIGLSIPVDYVDKKNKTSEFEKRSFILGYECACNIFTIIKERKIDLVHINSSVTIAGAIAAIMAGIPYIWHVRELIDKHYGLVFSDEKIKLLSKANVVIAISDYVKEEIDKVYNINSTKLYDYFNIKKYTKNNGLLSNRKNVFLVLGQISPSKGQWTAIKAIENLIELVPNIELNIVGNGSDIYVGRIKKYVNDHHLDKYININPFCNDISDYMDRASYILNCSKEEALGRVTIEGMLSKTLVVGAKSGATIELLEGAYKNSFLYEWNNYSDLKDKILEAIFMNDIDYDEQITTAYDYSMRTFCFNEYGKYIYSLYKGACRNYAGNIVCIEELSYKYHKYKKDINGNCNNSIINKSERAFEITCNWVKLHQMNRFVGDFLKENGINGVVVYGIAKLGELLITELEKSNISVSAVIDKSIEKQDNDLGMYNTLEFIDKEDYIIVTVASLEQELVKKIKEDGFINVIGLSELILLSKSSINK